MADLIAVCLVYMEPKQKQVHQDVMLVAGGANFPLGVPWRPLQNGRPSPKTYYTDIYCLSQRGDQQPTFTTASTRLPFAVGYGVAISYPGGVLCIGGEVLTKPMHAYNPNQP